jgi:hypothetical protein
LAANDTVEMTGVRSGGHIGRGAVRLLLYPSKCLYAYFHGLSKTFTMASYPFYLVSYLICFFLPFCSGKTLFHQETIALTKNRGTHCARTTTAIPPPHFFKEDSLFQAKQLWP